MFTKIIVLIMSFGALYLISKLFDNSKEIKKLKLKHVEFRNDLNDKLGRDYSELNRKIVEVKDRLNLVVRFLDAEFVEEDHVLRLPYDRAKSIITETKLIKKVKDNIKGSKSGIGSKVKVVK